MRGVWCLLLAVCCTLSASGQALRFSHDGGFYRDTFSLTIDYTLPPADTGCAIHYTLNGAAPTECDPVYNGPLPLTAACHSHSDLFRIQTVPDGRWYEPEGVEHCIVVRAAVLDAEGVRRSPIESQSYFIESLMSRRIGLPVVSICTDSAGLFDYDTGLFVRGYHHDPAYPYSTGNYFQKGRDWERVVSFGYYDTATALVQDCGLRMHGNSQRVLAQKGLSLYARSDYGDSRFRHPFFGEGRGDSFRRLVLRPWKTSWSAAGVEDWLCQQLAAGTGCDALASRPVVLFLNGEYWGVYFLEEKADEHYVEERFGVDRRQVDLLAYWGDEVEHGSNARWERLYDWLLQADLRKEEDWQHLNAEVDIDELLDYMLVQLLVLNDDWPVNNVRMWNAEGRRWRWIFFDGDGALASFPDNAAILDHMTYRNARQTTHSSPHSTLLFRRLLENKGFRQRSMERMADLVATVFAYENSAPLLHSIVEEVEDEVPFQSARFGTPVSMARWRMSVELIDDFLRSEPQATMQEYALYFGLKLPGREPATAVEDGVLRLEHPAQGETSFRVLDINGRERAIVTIKPGDSTAPLPQLPQGRYFIVPAGKGQAARWTVY